MTVVTATPRFGGPRNIQRYYDDVNNILRVLRPASTLRTCAAHLNAQGFQTPSGLEWTRERVANYLHTAAV